MTRLLVAFSLLLLVSCKTTTYYISRHAEKSGAMTSDPPLTANGQQQANKLKEYLTGKNINEIYSTNFARTKNTAQPTSDYFNVPIQTYSQVNALVDTLKKRITGNVLIIGHSNTVDEVVNRFMGSATMSDLPETEYGDVFIVRKKGGKYSFERIKVPTQ